ncbi:unnamed protein product [Ixodes pacificus]
MIADEASHVPPVRAHNQGTAERHGARAKAAHTSYIDTVNTPFIYFFQRFAPTPVRYCLMKYTLSSYWKRALRHRSAMTRIQSRASSPMDGC